VSNYDDPRWYEQPEINQGYRLVPDDRSRPTPATNSNDPMQQVPTKEPPPAKNPRFGRIFGQVVVTAALMMIAFLGGWFGHQAFTNSNFNPSNPSRSYANLFQQAWNIVDQNYVDRKAINYQQMSYQAIQAMLGVLHDTGHTRFLTPQDVQTEHQQLSGTLVGVGIYLRQDATTKQLTITSTISGTPAQKAG
jgi:carboxyl-terminal processing protease